jgi:2-iminobutanoate/2-iminopropanoate deaminase
MAAASTWVRCREAGRNSANAAQTSKGGLMKHLVLITTATLMVTSAGAAATRPPVEHFGHPSVSGHPLPFSDAVRVGDILYMSGQIGMGADGKLPDGIQAQTRLAMDNAGAILKRAGLGYGDVFHCTAFLKNMDDWSAFNAVYVTYFPDGKMPARSAIGANGLAMGALLEIECQANAGRK